MTSCTAEPRVEPAKHLAGSPSAHNVNTNDPSSLGRLPFFQECMAYGHGICRSSSRSCGSGGIAIRLMSSILKPHPPQNYGLDCLWYVREAVSAVTRECIFCDHVLSQRPQMIFSKLSLLISLVHGLLFLPGYTRLIACGRAFLQSARSCLPYHFYGIALVCFQLQLGRSPTRRMPLHLIISSIYTI